VKEPALLAAMYGIIGCIEIVNQRLKLTPFSVQF